MIKLLRHSILYTFCLLQTLLVAQETEYELSTSGTAIEQVLQDLEEKYGLLFTYALSEVEGIIISKEIQSTRLDVFLDQIFIDAGLEYELVEDQYVLLKRRLEKLVNLCGYIRDEESQTLLAFTNVYLEGTSYGTSTDDQGFFTLEVPESTMEPLQISYIGYQTQKILISKWDSEECLEISLKLPEYKDAFLVIRDYVTDGISLKDNGAATQLKPSRISSVPGQIDNDVLGLIQFLPGVNSASSKASDLSIRGGTPDQNLMLWENIPIYHAAHYFGMISAFNPEMIDEMNVFRGGFDPNFGGRISSVIDLKTNRWEKKKPRFYAGSNMTHAYLHGSSTFNQDQKGSLNFSVRRSFSEWLRTPTFDNITKVNRQGLFLGNNSLELLPDHLKIKDDFFFFDAHVKFDYQITPKTQIEIAALIAENNYQGEIIDDKRKETQVDSMELRNKGVSLELQHNWNQNATTSLSGVYTSYDYFYEYKIKAFGPSEPKEQGVKANEIIDQQLSLKHSIERSNESLVEFGYQLTNYNINTTLTEQRRNGNSSNESNKDQAYAQALFLQYKNPLSNKLGINVGFRATHFDLVNQWFFAPRLRLSLAATDYLSLHVYYGRHYQFISQINKYMGDDNGINNPIWTLAVNKVIPVQGSDIYQVGFIVNSNNWVVDVQAYHKNISGFSSRFFDFEILANQKDEVGNGTVRGIDFLVKKRINKFSSWISYSLSKAELIFPDLPVAKFLSNFDQTHVFQWNNQLNYKRFDFSIGLKYSSGLPYSKMHDYFITNNQEFVTYQGLYDGINNHRLPALYECNLTGKYQFNLGLSAQGFIGLSITNLLNTDNVYSRAYEIDSPQGSSPSIVPVDRSNLPFTPNMSFSVAF